MSQLPARRPTAYIGTFVHSTSLRDVEILEQKVIGVGEDGTIQFIHDEAGWEDKARSLGWKQFETIRAGADRVGFWFPGFVGTLPLVSA